MFDDPDWTFAPIGLSGPGTTPMLSQTAQYAIRAFAYIAAQGDQRPILAKEIASHTGVPSHYLSRILRDAVRAGLLESTRGVGGGFRLRRPASRIKLRDVLEPYDDVLDRSRCPFGLPRCNDDHPCGFHRHWKPIALAYRNMLENITLDLVGVAGLELRGKRATGRRGR